jgi:hypothetical protein
MSRAFAALLPCIALALGGVLYLEAGPGPSDTGAVEPAAGRMPEMVRPGQHPPAENVAPWVATILARPLFSPTRRPPAESAGPANAVAEVPRLAGVLVSDTGGEAIFAQPGQKPSVVRTGDRIGPYQVKSISAGEVTLAGPAGSVTMHPVFASAAEQPAPEPVKTPVGTAYKPRDKLRATPTVPLGVPSLAEVQNLIAKQQAAVTK